MEQINFSDKTFNENKNKLIGIIKQIIKGKLTGTEAKILLVSTLRKIDENDDGILWNNKIVNWNYEMELDNLLLPEIEKLDILSPKLKEITKNINLLKDNPKLYGMLANFVKPEEKKFKYGHNYVKTIDDYEQFYEKLQSNIGKYEITRKIQHMENKEDLVSKYAKEILEKLLPQDRGKKLKETIKQMYKDYERMFKKTLKQRKEELAEKILKDNGYEIKKIKFKFHGIERTRYEVSPISDYITNQPKKTFEEVQQLIKN